MPKKPTAPTPKPSMEDRMKAKVKELTAARDQAREQLAGLQNQIYAIEQLLNPPPVDEPAIEANEEPPNGVDIPEGTI